MRLLGHSETQWFFLGMTARASNPILERVRPASPDVEPKVQTMIFGTGGLQKTFSGLGPSLAGVPGSKFIYFIT